MRSDYKNGSGLWNRLHWGDCDGVLYVDANFVDGMKPEKVVENTLLFNELMGFKDLNPYVLNDDGSMETTMRESFDGDELECYVPRPYVYGWRIENTNADQRQYLKRRINMLALTHMKTLGSVGSSLSPRQLSKFLREHRARDADELGYDEVVADVRFVHPSQITVDADVPNPKGILNRYLNPDPAILGFGALQRQASADNRMIKNINTINKDGSSGKSFQWNGWTTQEQPLGRAPVFMITEHFGIPFPMNDIVKLFTLLRKNPNISKDASTDRWCMPTNVLIPIPDGVSPEQVGSIVLLNTTEFVMVKNVADPVRRGNQPLVNEDEVIQFMKPTWAKMDMLNHKHWSQFFHQPHRFADLTSDDESASMAQNVLQQFLATAAISSMHLNQEIGESANDDLFVPAWKDKRGVKKIDHATPHYPVFHDEIRCRACNGRVLILLPARNKIGSAQCPHCSEQIHFPHLISSKNQNDDKGGNESEDVLEGEISG